MADDEMLDRIADALTGALLAERNARRLIAAQQEFWQPGDRVEVLSMADDPKPITAGARGTVVAVRLGEYKGKPVKVVDVDWDGGRALSLVLPYDIAVKVEEQ